MPSIFTYFLTLVMNHFNFEKIFFQIFSYKMDIDQTGFRVVLYVIDDLRISFNKRLDHLEPWQIILYTLSVVLFTQWMKKVLKNEEIILPQKWVSI